MSAPLSALALAAAILLHTIALALTLGERSAAAAILLAEGLALAGVVLGWADRCPQATPPCPCGSNGLRRVAAQLVVAAAVALKAGGLPRPARAALIDGITAYTRINA
jgi:hypothetical protein